MESSCFCKISGKKGSNQSAGIQTKEIFIKLVKKINWRVFIKKN